MSSEIVNIKSSPLELKTVDDIYKVSDILAKSGMFGDVQSAAKCFVKVLAGKELGIPAFASMTGIHLIQGKPALSANLMASLIKGSGKYRYKKIKHTPEVCELEFFELWQNNWESLGISSFSKDDAQAAGLLGGNPNWKKYPKNMLFARAISNGFREFCPDLALGAPVYNPDELGAEISESGNVVDVEVPSPKSQSLLSEDRKQAGIAWAVGKGLAQSEAEQIANQATSEKELANLLQKAIDARQKPIEVHSENIDPGELLSEDF
jgi:hypothetical protein|uniref:RecT family protein n=1 Tax=Bacteriophage sp. TaxID=38018 RepID=A0A7G9A4H9_9VIRU|nr:MAG: hypothetical protein [Bacteriophage sp.]